MEKCELGAVKKYELGAVKKCELGAVKKCELGTVKKCELIIIINVLTARVVGAPQMILQPVFSIFLCSPLPSR